MLAIYPTLLNIFGPHRQFASIVSRLVSMAGFRLEHAESLGVNRHREGQLFKMHYDFVDEEGLKADPAFPSCQRAATVLAYLTDVEEGGETVFIRDKTFKPDDTPDPKNPDHLVVRPKKGRVLVWFDMHPYLEEVDFRTYHGARAVRKGEKIAATIFIRNCSKTGSYGAY
jgi:prolyl 4-hydroxylase